MPENENVTTIGPYRLLILGIPPTKPDRFYMQWRERGLATLDYNTKFSVSVDNVFEFNNECNKYVKAKDVNRYTDQERYVFINCNTKNFQGGVIKNFQDDVNEVAIQ